jgi:hypothetical protein
MPFSVNLGGFGVFGSRSGSAPSPFDAINGSRLAGPQGSHPLHSVRADELVRATDGPIGGEITLDQPARVGDGITGTIRLAATQQVVARGATLRLVGLRLDEVTRSEDNHDSDGHVTSSAHWVEVHGTLFSNDAFPEPAVPPRWSRARPGKRASRCRRRPSVRRLPTWANRSSPGRWRSTGTSRTVTTTSWPPICPWPSTRISCGPASASRAA